MAVRQYIGARYVTKIYENSGDPSSAEWEASVNYEPLIIVTYNNGSYMSKKFVPASVGNPADNPTYWTQTGFYNGQIASLQAQVDAINLKLDDMKKPNVIFLCDSYAAHTNSAGKNFIDIVVEQLGLDDYYLFRQNGIGFTTSPDSFLSLITAHISDVDDPNTITDVIVLGGANDYSSIEATITSAIGSFVSYIKTNFPNSKVTIGHIGTNRTDGQSVAQYSGRSIPAYKSCGQFGAVYMTGSEIIMHTDTYLKSDHIHPNDAGITALASGVINFMNGGRCYIRKGSGTATLSVSGSSIFSSINFSGQIHERIFDDSVNLSIQSNHLFIGLGLSSGLSGAVGEKIGSFTDRLILDGGHKCSVESLAAVLDGSNNTIGYVGATISIDNDGDLYLDLTPLDVTSFATAAKVRVDGAGSAFIAAMDC